MNILEEGVRVFDGFCGFGRDSPRRLDGEVHVPAGEELSNTRHRWKEKIKGIRDGNGDVVIIHQGRCSRHNCRCHRRYHGRRYRYYQHHHIVAVIVNIVIIVIFIMVTVIITVVINDDSSIIMVANIVVIIIMVAVIT